MNIKRSALYEKINTVCKNLEKEFKLISNKRKEKLLLISNYITQSFAQNQTPNLVFICTHNSRRSHIGQIWLAVGADYFKRPTIYTFSGGTEATAFNFRAVKAFQQLGFKITSQNKDADNPTYQISWKKEMIPYQAFSKKYNEKPNPKEKFAAIMVCSEADKECPLVFGCNFRLSLPYDDPKEFDGTDLEGEEYNKKLRQIGREMLFVLSQLNNHS